jgi:hypothetical protein
MAPFGGLSDVPGYRRRRPELERGHPTGTHDPVRSQYTSIPKSWSLFGRCSMKN